MDEEIEEDDDAAFSASTAVAIEKECAADAISEIFASVKAPFLPYVEAVVRALLPGLKHEWHDGIRKSAVSALLSFISTFHEMSEQPKWNKGIAGVSPSSSVLEITTDERFVVLPWSQRRSARCCHPPRCHRDVVRGGGEGRRQRALQQLLCCLDGRWTRPHLPGLYVLVSSLKERC